MRIPILALSLTTLALAACGGSGSSPTPTTPTMAPTVAPSGSPTTAPTVSPSSTPVPLALRSMAGAPLTATASQLSTTHRTAQAKTQAQGIANGLPILVESSGMVAAWAGDQSVWVTNSQNPTQDIAETAGTITPSGNLPISNPGLTPLSCIGQVSAVCIAHPLGWEFGTSSANGKPVGKQTISIAFSDGTTGTTSDYVYDGWNLPCNTGWVYQNGVPVATTTLAGSDVYADCVNSNIDFPKGATLFASPVQDQYGRNETIMPTLTAAFVVPSLNAIIPMSAIAPGIVFGVETQDGGSAKVYFSNGASSTTVNAANGMSLHAALNGPFAF